MQTSSSKSPNGSPLPAQTLMTTFPIVQLRGRLVERLTTLEKFAPNSDSVATLKECVAEVDEAITLGQNTSVFIGVDEASTIFRRPRSTITHICRTHGKRAGAKKVEGVWVINHQVMEGFFTGDDHGVAA